MSHQETITRMKTDIPLKSAMIAWNPKFDATSKHEDLYPSGIIVVVPWPDTWNVSKKLLCTTGACLTAWHEISSNERIKALFIETWHIICRDGINPQLMHLALMVIPEYRITCGDEKFFQWHRPHRPDLGDTDENIDYCLKQLKQLPLAHDIAPDLTNEEVYGALVAASSIIKQQTENH